MHNQPPTINLQSRRYHTPIWKPTFQTTTNHNDSAQGPGLENTEYTYTRPKTNQNNSMQEDELRIKDHVLLKLCRPKTTLEPSTTT
ncbi:hypothetical protein GIB67_035679 [Kingdonia uniflora]|uniref:Uncharacterized protein n=1 Tax=Kingdonia uniflora TaxID=39325 RepID=A0A7J7MIW0_9MAGN|nr:hypothetical protein GIB67_035679 [Kingdonia uniflora]